MRITLDNTKKILIHWGSVITIILCLISIPSANQHRDIPFIMTGGFWGAFYILYFYNARFLYKTHRWIFWGNMISFVIYIAFLIYFFAGLSHLFGFIACATLLFLHLFASNKTLAIILQKDKSELKVQKE
jgi:hypothetical protein